MGADPYWFALFLGPMESVKYPVNDRREDDAHHDDEHQAGVQRVHACEQLPWRAQILSFDRPHPAQKHGRIEECIQPGHVLVVRVADHAGKQRNPDQRQGHASMGQHAERKPAQGYRRRVMWLVHDPDLCSLCHGRADGSAGAVVGCGAVWRPAVMC